MIFANLGKFKVCKFISTNLNFITCREKWLAANLGNAICCGVKSEFLTYMLSQNRARVLGFSWFRRCLNQRWMVRTSQSSC